MAPQTPSPADPTWAGTVHAIHLAPARGAPAQAVESVEVVPGRGLVGDRHFRATVPADRKTWTKREITLIELEAIEALTRDYEVTIAPGDARRNVITRGVPLNHLVDREFRVGEVRLLGTMLCEPCRHLAGLTHPDVLPGLKHRGGLCARILEGGTIRPGDAIHL